MYWDQAMNVLLAAGYEVELVGPDQWRMRRRRGNDVEERILSERFMIAMAESMHRAMPAPRTKAA